MWTSAELKLRAKGAFYKNYWHCVLTALVMLAFEEIVIDNGIKFIRECDDYIYYDMYGIKIMIGLSGIIFLLVKVFLGNPMVVGGCRFFIKNQTVNPTAAELGFVFQPQSYGNAVLTMFLRNLYISLWSLLLVVPGIIKHYEYLMVPYILAENPEMDSREAFLISRRMMMGQKLNVFILDLTFIGWVIVSKLTFGIAGIFFVQPYYQATKAELYSVNRMKAYQEGYIR